MSPDAELGETGSCHTELAVWKEGGKGGGMLQEELPCKTTLTVKAANTSQSMSTSGADPGFFLGGGGPLRNAVTDGEVKKKLKANTYLRRSKLHLRGGGRGAPPAPSH